MKVDDSNGNKMIIMVLRLVYIYVLNVFKFRSYSITMVLTRQEKEKQILDLYNQGQTYKQIAKTVRVSPRDIKPVLKKAEKERERELGLTTLERDKSSTENRETQKKTSFSSRAYRLFSENKTPLDVAIELNLRESDATRYYREHWRLKWLHDLDLIYEEIKDDINYIIKLYRKMKAEGVGVKQVINIIKIANNDLPAVEQKYQNLKRKINFLESRKLEGYKTLGEIKDQIKGLEKMLGFLETSCQEVNTNIDKLEREEIRLKKLVKLFKENDEEYLKIKGTVKKEVSQLLLEGRQILRVAVYSIMVSMREDPEKYSALIYYGKDTLYGGQNKTSYTTSNKYQSQFETYNPFFESLKSVVLENSHKLYKKLLKEETNKVISRYPSESPALLSTTKVTMLREFRYFRGTFDTYVSPP
jgi:hypothetical protein